MNESKFLKILEELKKRLKAGGCLQKIKKKAIQIPDESKEQKKAHAEDYYVVVKMPNAMYFPFYDKFAPFDRMLRIVEGKEVNNLQSITPLVITHCSNDWIPFAVKEGGVVKKIQFKI